MPTKLVYVDDELPGITRRSTRRAAGHGWAYFDPHGERIKDRDEIDRLNGIGMPPAYRDCWFCPSPHGHIQAIGYDDKGRKQYRYHLEFRAAQDAEKYAGCADFGRMLPLVRRQVDSDLTNRKLDKRTCVAAIVRLLDLGHVRVGNRCYAQENGSFGATTLRSRHATVRGGSVSLCYRGKSGKEQKLTIADKRLSRVVKRCQDLPGQHLFQYLDPDGSRHEVSSSDVNDYLREASGEDVTAKHFRTWGASVIAYRAIVEAGRDGIGLKAMLEPVAKALGNTPAIARKSYVHPALIDLAKAGGLTDGLPDGAPVKLPRATRWLDPAERGLLALLEDLAQTATAKKAA